LVAKNYAYFAQGISFSRKFDDLGLHFFRCVSAPAWASSA
jgi:hypothetical protein